MLTATALTYTAIRREFPAAIKSGQRTWLISVAADIGGITWDKALALIFDPYQTTTQAVCFEQIGEIAKTRTRDARAVVLVGIRRRACAASPSASL